MDDHKHVFVLGAGPDARNYVDDVCVSCKKTRAELAGVQHQHTFEPLDGFERCSECGFCRSLTPDEAHAALQAKLDAVIPPENVEQMTQSQLCSHGAHEMMYYHNANITRCKHCGKPSALEEAIPPEAPPSDDHDKHLEEHRKFVESLPQQTPSESILDEANRIVNGARAQTYGDAHTAFGRIAALWDVWLGERITTTITAHDVAMMMVLMKVSRERSSHQRDNLVDIAGYAELAERLSKSQENEDKLAIMCSSFFAH